MNRTKIRLSAVEMELVQNSEWILTKNLILNKAVQMLAALQQQYRTHLLLHHSQLPTAFADSSPKISRGENYEGLPYRVLDYPAIFRKENNMAIRTMFWWGNFFSITLHLSGLYKEQFTPKILAAYTKLKQAGFYISTGSGEWNHRFTEENYTPLQTLKQEAFATLLQENRFAKIAANTNVKNWEKADEFLSTKFELLVKLLAD